MVQITSFVVTTLLACSTVFAAPLVARNSKSTIKNAPLVNSTSILPQSNVTSIDNSTSSIANGTVVATPPDLTNSTLVNGTDVSATNGNGTLCDSGLTTNSTKKAHHKGGAKGGANAAKGKAGGAKANAKAGAKAKGGHQKGNSTSNATGLPPCSSLVNSTATIDNTTSVDVNSTSTPPVIVNPTLPGKPLVAKPVPGGKGPGKEDADPVGKGPKAAAKAGDIARRFVRSFSRAPKRRLEPVPIWDDEE